MARCGTVFPASAVVGAAVPAVVCTWGCANAVLVWGGVSRGYTIIPDTPGTGGGGGAGHWVGRGLSTI